jgi:hypothetical protein
MIRISSYLWRILIVICLVTVLPENSGRANDLYGSLLPSKTGIEVIESEEDFIVLQINTPIIFEQTILVGGKKQATLEIPGADESGITGFERVPVLAGLIGIPINSLPEISIVAEDLTTLNGTYSFARDHNIGTLEDTVAQDLSQFEPTPLEDSTPETYPASPVQVETAWLRDQKVARLTIYPLQILAAQGTVVWRKMIKVRVSFVQEENQDQIHQLLRSNPVPSPAYEAIYESTLLNYQQAREWRGTAMPEMLSEATDLYEATGPRYKIVVDQDGLYRISYDTLQALGMDVAHIDPRQLQLSSQGYEVAIQVNGESNGVFEPGEYLEFYGEAFYGELLAQRYSSEGSQYLTQFRLTSGQVFNWSPEFNATMLEKYTKENVYWLQVAESPGTRMAILDGTPDSSTYLIPATYTQTVHAELEKYWFSYNFSSEDTWFWDRVTNTNQRVYTTTLSALPTEPFTATIRGEIVARVFSSSNNPDHHTKIWLNETSDPLEDAYWDGFSRHRFEVATPGTVLDEGLNELKFQVFFDAYSNQVVDNIYFDWYEVEYPRRFIAENEQIFFHRDEGGQIWRYEIDNFSSPGVEVFEVSDSLRPKRVMVPDFSSGRAVFESMQSGEVDYFVAGINAIQTPKSISFYEPPDLKSPSNGADYLIITHADFISTVQPLADIRSAKGLSTMIVDVNDLYNEFNDGIFHSIAIKNFLRYAYYYWSKRPTYVMLVGDGHWNFFNSATAYLSPPMFLPPHLAWVDPWQGEVDSSNLLVTLAGDDVLPDMLIGQMPVNSTSELNAVLSKIISYETQGQLDWQRRLLFITDNPDEAGNFNQFADNIISDYLEPGYQADRIYTSEGCGGNCPALIANTLTNTGAVLASYIGHAAITNWGGTIFRTENVPSLANGNRLPVVLTLTCQDGYSIHPGDINGTNGQGLIETLLRADNKGVVGAFSPSGLGVATGHDALQRGFFDSLFNNGIWGLGQAALAGKLRLYATGGNFDLIQTYSVFGDPALKIKEHYETPGVSPASETQWGLAGRLVTYSVQITNPGPITDTYRISVSNNEWTTDTPVSVGPVPSGEFAAFAVSVMIPPDAIYNDSDVANIRISSAGDIDEMNDVELTTFANQVPFIIQLPGIFR